MKPTSTKKPILKWAFTKGYPGEFNAHIGPFEFDITEEGYWDISYVKKNHHSEASPTSHSNQEEPSPSNAPKCGAKPSPELSSNHATKSGSSPNNIASLYKCGLVEKFITSNRSTLFLQTGQFRTRTTVSNRLTLSREREREGETTSWAQKDGLDFLFPKKFWTGRVSKKFQRVAWGLDRSERRRAAAGSGKNLRSPRFRHPRTISHSHRSPIALPSTPLSMPFVLPSIAPTAVNMPSLVDSDAQKRPCFHHMPCSSQGKAPRCAHVPRGVAPGFRVLARSTRLATTGETGHGYPL